MSTPDNKVPADGQSGDPKTNAAEKEVVTNADDSEKVVNTDGLVADTAGIEEMLTESDPTPALNADTQVTNHDAPDSGTDANEVL
jgi:hypothetical protein